MRAHWVIGFILSFSFIARQSHGEDIPARLSISKAVETALARHAAIQAAAARTAASAFLQQQAGLRPNPTISLDTENWRGWGSPGFRLGQDVDLFLAGSQTFEAGGKRSRRVELAGQDLRVAELEQLALEWKIRQDVRLAFLRALSAQKQLALLEENGSYFEKVVEYHRVRVEQGAMAEANLIRVQIESERFRLEADSARAEAERQRIGLLRVMGLAESRADFLLEDVAPPPNLALSADALVSQAREHLPGLRVAEAVITRARARLDLEKALVKPDWTISFGYKRTAGFNTILAGVLVPLPVFNKNQGNIYAVEQEVRRAEYLSRETLAQVTSDIAAALAGMQRRREMLARMQKGLLEQAEESMRISLAAYQEGGADLLRLLDAQRVRNEVRLLFARTQMEYIISIAELENTVGVEGLLLPKET